MQPTLKCHPCMLFLDCRMNNAFEKLHVQIKCYMAHSHLKHNIVNVLLKVVKPRTFRKTRNACVHLLTGLSVSSNLRIDLPSISAGMSIPAMSNRVGAKSMFRTI